MPTLSVPPHLIQYVASSSTSQYHAAEALEEWIWQRRNKGDSLFEVSVGLLDLEDRAPQKSLAFDRARYLTHIPPPTELTPPDGGRASTPTASASPVTILHHLLSSPEPFARSREIVLEYALARETKLREKKSGRGGKGTLDREGLEDVGARLGEVEDGLQPGVHEMDEARQMGLALILALRMSMSYFTLPALGKQLLLLAIPDAERVLVQHVRRRVEAEGRYGVGKELEYLESMTTSRPALRPAFRSAKAKTTLPESPVHQIPLPAPSKSSCIKLIANYIRDTDGFSPKMRSNTLSGSLSERNLASVATPNTPSSMTTYVLELVTEYITREKREYMLKCKWTVKGREALAKDLGDIESTICMAKGGPSPVAPHLIPTFLVLRRTFGLPPTPLPAEVVEPYYDILPAPPDGDDEYREPTVGNTTASLYVNPRLDDADAAVVLEELVESEREKAIEAGIPEEEVQEIISGLVEQVEKRFPDGSYAAVFSAARGRPVQAEVQEDTEPIPIRRNSLHNRALSSYMSPVEAQLDIPAVPQRRNSHNRSTSLPTNNVLGGMATAESTPDLSSIASAMPTLPDTYPNLADDTASSPLSFVSYRSLESSGKPFLPAISTSDPFSFPTQFLSPDMEHVSSPDGDRRSSGGWWDVVSAVDSDSKPPWQRSNNSLMSALASSPSKSMEHSREMLRAASGDSYDPPVSPSVMASTMLPPGAAPAMVRSPSNPLRVEESMEGFAPLQLESGVASTVIDHTPRLQHALSPESPAQSPPQSPPLSPLSPALSNTLLSYDQPDSNVTPFTPGTSPRTRPPPVPIMMNRPNFPSPQSDRGSSPATPNTGTSPVKGMSKLASFGRTMTISRRRKEKERSASIDMTDKAPLNDPGRWNRDMVASIMGQPAEKR